MEQNPAERQAVRMLVVVSMRSGVRAGSLMQTVNFGDYPFMPRNWGEGINFPAAKKTHLQMCSNHQFPNGSFAVSPPV